MRAWPRLHAAGGVDPDGRDVDERLGHVGRGEAAGQHDRDALGDGPGRVHRGAPSGASERSRIARVKQDGPQVRLVLVRFGLFRVRLGQPGGLIAPGVAQGGDVQHLQHRQADGIEIAGRLVAMELHHVEVEPPGDGCHLRRVAIGEDPYQQRTVPRRLSCACGSDEGGSFGLA